MKTTWIRNKNSGLLWEVEDEQAARLLASEDFEIAEAPMTEDKAPKRVNRVKRVGRVAE